MAENLNLPAKSVSTIRDLLEKEDVQNEIRKALPGVMNADQLMRATITLFRKNPKLMECTQLSLLSCFIGSAQLGLSTDPMLGHVYWVPFWNPRVGNKGAFEAELIPGYQGLMQLELRSGQVKIIEARARFKNEPFDISFGLHPRLDHGIADGDPGELVGTWAKRVYVDDYKTFDYMNLWEIKETMEKTKSRDKQGKIVGPWITNFVSMAIKSVIRRSHKMQPVSIEDLRYQKAIEIDEKFEALGPGFQKDLFLPESKPLEIGDSRFDDHEKFIAEMGETVLNDPNFSEFMAIASKANNMTLDQFESEALENIDAFKAAYQKWLKQKSEKKAESGSDPSSGSKTTAAELFIREWNFLRDPEKLKDYVLENLDRFEKHGKAVLKKAKDKYNRIVGEPWPQKKGSGTGSQGSQGGNSKGSSDITFDELVQSDEWQEMSVLKEQFPDIWNEKSGGRPPRTMEALKKLIDDMSVEIDKLSADGGGIPGA